MHKNLQQPLENADMENPCLLLAPYVLEIFGKNPKDIKNDMCGWIIISLSSHMLSSHQKPTELFL